MQDAVLIDMLLEYSTTDTQTVKQNKWCHFYNKLP